MSLKTDAEEFLAQQRIAVVGVSHDQGTANLIYERMLDRGYDVFPVNPNMEKINGRICYPDLKSIPGGVEAVMIVTRPEVSEKIVQECADVGVWRVWLHHNPMFGQGSSASKAAVEFCQSHGIHVISEACPLMYGKTADFGHKCMRWVMGVTGALHN